MRYHVVTTMNESAWQSYGERMIDSFVKCWPQDCLPISIYAEGFEVNKTDVCVLRLPRWIDEFKAIHKLDPKKNGLRRGHYDYRFDGVKFAHKVAAMTDFGLKVKDGIMVWLDADTFTHSKVSCEWLSSLFPGNGYVAWLDRLNSYIETGFLMFRVEHKSHKHFMTELERIYRSGQVFKMPETHDSFVIHYLIRLYQSLGNVEKPVSLSGDVRWHHPFINGPLGSRLDHMKGPRKERGHSDVKDLKVRRPEPYWRDR